MSLWYGIDFSLSSNTKSVVSAYFCIIFTIIFFHLSTYYLFYVRIGIFAVDK